MEKNSSIELSIVILTYNKPYELSLVLTGLKHQNLAIDSTEIIIVDDGSDLEAVSQGCCYLDVINSFSKSVNVRFFSRGHTGNRAENRNYGVTQCNGIYLLFIDGDMIPDLDAVVKHMNILQNGKKCVSLGSRLKLLEFDTSMITMHLEKKMVELLRQYPAYSDERIWMWEKGNSKMLNECAWIQVYSHNIGVRKDIFEDVGGFDSEFDKNWGAEDIELGYRFYKAGCTIIADSSIQFFHINHEEDLKTKHQQLDLNLQLFFRKHPDWKIELLRYEYRIWIIAYLDIVNKIHSGMHLVHNAGKIEASMKELSGKNGISIGIVDQNIIDHESISSVVSTKRLTTHKVQIPLLGTVLPYHDKSFDFAIISEDYKKIEMFDLISLEAHRIASRVYVIRNSGFSAAERKVVSEEQMEGSLLHHVHPQKKVIFSLSSINDEILIDHVNILNLAWYLHKRGVHVCLRDNLSDLDRADLSMKFYYPANSHKRKTLESLYKCTHDFFLSIPNISHERYTCNRSFGGNWLWYDSMFENDTLEFKAEFLDTHDYFLYRNQNTYNLLGCPDNASFLPIGVDIDSIEDVLINDSRNSGTLKFLWIASHIGTGCGLDIVVDAFTDTFQGRKDVVLEIIAPSFLDYRPQLFANKSLNGYLESIVKISNNTTKDYLKPVLKKIKSSGIVSILRGEFSDAAIYKHIANAHCIIDTNPSIQATPMILDALAIGKKVIRPDNFVYDQYDAHFGIIPVKYNNVSRIIHGALPEMVWNGIAYQSKARYQLLHCIDMDALKRTLSEIDHHRDVLHCELSSVTHFREKNNWNAVLECLLPLL